MLRILIADDHEMVRRGVRTLIDDHPLWVVCGEACDGNQALALARQAKPDVAIVDISLPGLNGLALTRALRKECSGVRTVLFTMHGDEETIALALEAGARGYVLKSDGGASLEAAIAALGHDRPYFSSAVSEVLLQLALDEKRRSRVESFTKREVQVVQLIAEGRSNKEIARQLDICAKTVETHRSAGMRKADVRTAAQYVRFAIRQKMIDA